jgi:putative ABC transport system permease protein
VKTSLEDALAPYGLEGLYEQEDQPSNAMLTQEINSLGSMASSVPMVFILMAIVILYIMLKRVIEQERSQIGTLKALGYSSGDVLLHYMSYGLLIGILGGLLGVAGGVAMAGGMTDMYLEFFYLPSLRVDPKPSILITGLVIAVGSGAFGS